MNDVMSLDAIKDLAIAAKQNVANEQPSGGGFDGRQLLRMDQQGEWSFGVERNSPDGAIRVHPASFQRGYVLWENSQIQAEAMTPINQDYPEGAPPGSATQWQFDAATEYGEQLRYKVSSQGGCERAAELCDTIMDRVIAGEEAIVPVVELDSDSYRNQKYGRTIYKPVFNIVGWETMNGPTTKKIEEPKRARQRRVV
jgi:hypothetical protein